jgi:hypothetical protein
VDAAGSTLIGYAIERAATEDLEVARSATILRPLTLETTMHRTDRFFFRLFSRWFPATLLHLDAPSLGARRCEGAGSAGAATGGARAWGVLCLAVALGAGCTLITDVDRSKIPAAEVIPPPAPPPVDSSDGGAPPSTESDAGSSGTARDAGDAAVGDGG